MSAEDPLSDVLVIQDRLPLAWREVDVLPGGEALARINEANEGLLRVFVSLDDATPRISEEAGGEMAHELARIDAKLNVLMEMVGSLLHSQLKAPEPVSMRISGEGLGWVQGEHYARGQYLALDWHLCPQLPRPLELFGRVVRCQATQEGFDTVIRFCGLSPLLEDGIQKLVFRRHRRSVAQSRAR